MMTSPGYSNWRLWRSSSSWENRQHPPASGVCCAQPCVPAQRADGCSGEDATDSFYLAASAMELYGERVHDLCGSIHSILGALLYHELTVRVCWVVTYFLARFQVRQSWSAR